MGVSILVDRLLTFALARVNTDERLSALPPPGSKRKAGTSGMSAELSSPTKSMSPSKAPLRWLTRMAGSGSRRISVLGEK